MPNHERIDPRRGPGRERDDGRREIDAGVAEYEEDRDAREADEYDSREDLDFTDFDDADISARVENNRIVIEVPLPANTSPERWAKIIERQTRRITVELIGGGKTAAPARPPRRGDLP